MTTLDLIGYYRDLLTRQYVGKPNARATIEAVITPLVMPQTLVALLDGGTAALTGPLSMDGGSAGTTTWAAGIDGGPSFQKDVTLPLAVQNGFNLVAGTDTAEGKQLDVIGKYVGVSRSGFGFTTQLTLSDSDFLTMIRLAIVKNSSGSSLYDIQGLLALLFPGKISVTDYQNMLMSYAVSSDVASAGLLQLVVTEGLLPRPMGVALFVVIFDSGDPFTFDSSGFGGGFGDITDATLGGMFASIYAP